MQITRTAGMILTAMGMLVAAASLMPADAGTAGSVRMATEYAAAPYSATPSGRQGWSYIHSFSAQVKTPRDPG